jgi:T-complex protein 1 subunit theta
MSKSMSLNAAAGLSGMLKAGHQHMEGVEGATVRNLEAAKQLSTIVQSSLGPNGMNKLVVNHLGKTLVTSDCAAIVKELEIEHPAAKMLQLAAEMQDSECGDGTNLTVSFAGELLAATEDLLRMGLHTSEIIAGYKKASHKLLDEILPSLVCSTVDSSDKTTLETQLLTVLKPVLAAKQYGYEGVLAPLVATACLGTMSSNSSKVHAENVRVAKVLGGSVAQSKVIHGFVALRGVESSLTSATDAKVTVFACGIEMSTTEAKGTVLMNNAEDLKGYNKSEELKMEEIIKSIADTGTKVIITGGTISEMALHFVERYKLVALRISSKWELRRLCAATGATALVRLGPATADEMGFSDLVQVQEVGGRPITVFETQASKLSTILLRASTSSLLADLERAVDDGVHACRVACQDGRLVPGGGATEMECSLRVKQFGDTCPGLDQYAIRTVATVLEFVPRTLAQNAGLHAGDTLAALGAAHANGQGTHGIDITGKSSNGIFDTAETQLVDLLATKESAFRLALDAALTVLKVDQIIMSKPSGGGRAN